LSDLSADNPSLLFVTLFLGTLNIKDGTLEYCNGGHNPPYIIRASGEIEAVETTGGIALGVVEDFSFQSKPRP
jgi:sigma-B regulation protein RsbU (phosphoserine phosphatase)